MAFPVVEATATTAGGTSTTHNVTLPASSSGELLVIEMMGASADGASESTAPAGWIKEPNTGFLRVFFKVAEGDEGTSVTITSANSQRAAFVARRISGHDGEIEVAFGGLATDMDPPNLEPSWGSGDTLWIATTGGLSSDYTFVAPTNYTDIINRTGDGVSSATSRCIIGSAERELAASSENPGAFTTSGAGSPDNGQSATIAIRPLGIIDPINPTTDENGYDITVDSTNTTPSNFEVKVNGGSAINPASVRQISATQVRLRMPNANRILSTDTVTVSSTAQSVTDESATNNSVQTSTTVAVPTVNGGRVVYTFASAPTVGILASGEPTVTDAVNVTGVTYTAGTNEEQYRIGGSVLNPDALNAAGSGKIFHPNSINYTDKSAASYPLSLSADDCLVTGVSLPDLDTHATSTAFSLGDTIEEGGRYYRCTVAGTTAGTKPGTFGGATTVTDGTVTWTRGGSNGDSDEGRSLVRKVTVLHCSGSTLKSQDTYRCAFSDGATKSYYTRADVDDSLLPGDDNGLDSIDDYEALVKHPWWEPGFCQGGAESETIPEENMGHPYGRDLFSRAITAVGGLMGDQSYNEDLLDYIIQRGIDYIGMREAGLYLLGFEGWTNGRAVFGSVASRLLGLDIEDFLTPASGSPSTDIGRGLGEVREQIGYITAAFDGDSDENYEYFDGNAGTYVDPSNAPSTYPGDKGADDFHPADIRGDWLHTPENGGRFARTPLGTDNFPTFFNPNGSTNYRQIMSQRLPGWAYIVDSLGLDELTDAFDAMLDYTARYEVTNGTASLWDFDALWTLYEAGRPTFAFTATAVDVAGTWYIDLTFNRYATQTNANILAQFACSGSVTLSNADQTGPRTFRVQASADPRGQTVTYTQSGTAGERVVDAGDNELPTGSDAAIAEASGGGEDTISLGSTIRPRNPYRDRNRVY